MDNDIKRVVDTFIEDLKEAAIKSDKNPFDVWDSCVTGFMQGLIEMKAAQSKVSARQYAVDLLKDHLIRIDQVRG